MKMVTVKNGMKQISGFLGLVCVMLNQVMHNPNADYIAMIVI